VIGVEPSAGDDATRSFQTKHLQHVHNPLTIADGARTPSMSEMTFRLMLDHVGGMTTVDDGPLLDAMFYLWERLKLLVEPTGALGAAAAFENKVSIAGRRVGIMLTGGNVDLSQVGEWRTLGRNSP
jgi:threonine dehydratase